MLIITNRPPLFKNEGNLLVHLSDTPPCEVVRRHHNSFKASVYGDASRIQMVADMLGVSCEVLRNSNELNAAERLIAGPGDEILVFNTMGEDRSCVHYRVTKTVTETEPVVSAETAAKIKGLKTACYSLQSEEGCRMTKEMNLSGHADLILDVLLTMSVQKASLDELRAELAEMKRGQRASQEELRVLRANQVALVAERDKLLKDGVPEIRSLKEVVSHTTRERDGARGEARMYAEQVSDLNSAVSRLTTTGKGLLSRAEATEAALAQARAEVRDLTIRWNDANIRRDVLRVELEQRNDQLDKVRSELELVQAQREDLMSALNHANAKVVAANTSASAEIQALRDQASAEIQALRDQAKEQQASIVALNTLLSEERRRSAEFDRDRWSEMERANRLEHELTKELEAWKHKATQTLANANANADRATQALVHATTKASTDLDKLRQQHAAELATWREHANRLEHELTVVNTRVKLPLLVHGFDTDWMALGAKGVSSVALRDVPFSPAPLLRSLVPGDVLISYSVAFSEFRLLTID